MFLDGFIDQVASTFILLYGSPDVGMFKSYAQRTTFEYGGTCAPLFNFSRRCELTCYLVLGSTLPANWRFLCLYTVVRVCAPSRIGLNRSVQMVKALGQ